MILLLMGVQGSGKTTVGTALAKRLGWQYLDADDYHPPANIAKMSAGVPLTDEDRAPWLAAIRAEIDRALAEGRNLVFGCSALKEKYREELVVPGVSLVFLRASYELIASRLRLRKEHFAKLDLLPSQFEQLEEPRDAIVVDASHTVEEIVGQIVEMAGLS